MDLPDTAADARVERRVEPDKDNAGMQQDTANGRSADTSPAQEKPKKVYKALSSASRVPVGLHKQAMREQADVRHVRHAPDHIRRKVDGKPAMQHPPIYEKNYKRLRRAALCVLFLTVFIASVAGYMLFGTEDGQKLMAQWGWEAARTDAYVTYGRELVELAYFTRALEPLEVAVQREPDNVDALLLKAQALTELGRVEEAKPIYESLMTDIAPEHPSAYRNLIRIYQQQGYNAEALALMKTASENAIGTQEFDVMLREYTPSAPTFSQPEGRYNEEIDVTIAVPDGQTVYYTTDGTDPSEAGLVYNQGMIIHIPEGKMTVKAIGFTDNGMPSEQITANYTVIIPTPAAPKANYAAGKYKKAPKVSLRAGDEEKNEFTSPIVAFYYTLDGRQATTESTLYTGPIQIPVGDSELRAIAVAENGKISYEMRVTYSVQGNLKYMFRSQDTFKNMELYKTGYNTFTKNWGAPQTYEVLPEEEWYSPDMESYEAVYDWGTARFLIKKAGASPVLYALDTKNPKMTAPRSTKIGMSGQDVMAKYRDLGHPELDAYGNRLLYNWDSAGFQFGTYRYEADGGYAIHYYYPIGDKKDIFVELSYYLDDNLDVDRIVWQRYISELTE
ncbi:MAG: chitobiase/beta-hexosaminidase C-terminal domain-containing protein [Clostridia bacterium]|nr:chitobiase/beta-hexosaminidase C-terminal domain-containing protein [Clostridia bacterium]